MSEVDESSISEYSLMALHVIDLISFGEIFALLIKNISCRSLITNYAATGNWKSPRQSDFHEYFLILMMSAL